MEKTPIQNNNTQKYKQHTIGLKSASATHEWTSIVLYFFSDCDQAPSVPPVYRLTASSDANKRNRQLAVTYRTGRRTFRLDRVFSCQNALMRRCRRTGIKRKRRKELAALHTAASPPPPPRKPATKITPRRVTSCYASPTCAPTNYQSSPRGRKVIFILHKGTKKPAASE